jgi:ABC-2 type transport system ATP-binding protein
MVSTIRPLLDAASAAVELEPDGALAITGTSVEAVGELAASHGVVLHELSFQHASLEEAFMELTDDSVEYRSDTPQRALAHEVA